MKEFMTVGLAAVLIAMAAGCNRAIDTGADAQAIGDIEKQWNQDFAKKDAGKLAENYADHAVLMAPGMAPSVGRESIRAALKEMVADPALSLKFTAAKIEVSQSGDMGYTRGAYVMTMTDPQTKRVVSDRGSYVTTYRKEADGKWKAVADIASSEAQPGLQAASK
jgi:uncharacterized protein (TIGR02246 family)